LTPAAILRDLTAPHVSLPQEYPEWRRLASSIRRSS
jgi:hypothetical protein